VVARLATNLIIGKVEILTYDYRAVIGPIPFCELGSGEVVHCGAGFCLLFGLWYRQIRRVGHYRTAIKNDRSWVIVDGD
jgi:hypothetical protein